MDVAEGSLQHKRRLVEAHKGSPRLAVTTMQSAAVMRGHQLAFIGANLSSQTRGVAET